MVLVVPVALQVLVQLLVALVEELLLGLHYYAWEKSCFHHGERSDGAYYKFCTPSGFDIILMQRQLKHILASYTNAFLSLITVFYLKLEQFSRL